MVMVDQAVEEGKGRLGAAVLRVAEALGRLEAVAPVALDQQLPGTPPCLRHYQKTLQSASSRAWRNSPPDM